MYVLEGRITLLSCAFYWMQNEFILLDHYMTSNAICFYVRPCNTLVSYKTSLVGWTKTNSNSGCKYYILQFRLPD